MFDHTTRRRFVVSASALTTVALAGCTDSGSAGGDGDEMEEDGTMESEMDENGTMESEMEEDGTMESETNESSMDG